MYIFLFISIIAIIVFFNNFVAILKKVKDGQETGGNTFLCCITLIYIWGCLIICVAP
ncbi:hypothetical protein KPL42_10405 [Clostridium gasigenes]|uniref:Uncharacterized protein n=1 Tax=Clostridium gasigenes TaxID=94869 RepID=A0A1H0T4D8_9CLOT|nr:hypothetical protein [Clostridium gasigenes]MBU3088897.1 hypothetical protein [Clostridium gasigenes]SDP48829.1 hypothetical protein SAMN04488529_10659 [Clostridium gasigenes]